MLIFAYVPGPLEVVVVLVVLVLLFGKRLPELGRSLGKGFVEFKKGVKGIENEIKVDVDSAADEQMSRENEIDAKDALVCSNCGTKNDKTAVFCSSCGQRIGPV